MVFFVRTVFPHKPKNENSQDSKKNHKPRTEITSSPKFWYDGAISGENEA